MPATMVPLRTRIRVTFLRLALAGTMSCLVAAVAASQPAPYGATSAGSAALADQQALWLGPDGEPLPFHSDEEALAFLGEAKVREKKPIKEGITLKYKVRLERDGVVARGIFKTIDKQQDLATIGNEVIPGFKDWYACEVLAYRVSRLLGIDNVPPAVLRRLRREQGSMQLWVERAMSEQERRESDIPPPTAEAWRRQRQTMHLFDALIDNFDRNLGNQLIDVNWRLWFIDHSRSFTRRHKASGLEHIVYCERSVWERLQALDRETLAEALRPPLSYVEIDALLSRRQELVRHVEKLISERGREAVILE